MFIRKQLLLILLGIFLVAGIAVTIVKQFETKKNLDWPMISDPSSKSSPVFYFFTNKDNNPGDAMHAEVVASLLKEKYKAQIEEWDVRNFEAFYKILSDKLSKVESGASVETIVWGVGPSSISVLEKLCQDPILRGKLLIGFSAHELVAGAENLQGKIDVMVLEKEGYDEKAKRELGRVDEQIRAKPHYVNTQITTMTFIPHRITEDFVKGKLAEWRLKSMSNPMFPVIPTNKRVVVVPLGGDVFPLVFGEKEAEVLAEFIIKTEELNRDKDAVIEVTNGRRTGQFGPKAGGVGFEELKVHIEGAELDKTTAAFLRTLEKQGIPKERIVFVDYKKDSLLPSAYPPFLGAALEHPRSVVYLTADSTSMMSEIGDLLLKRSQKLVLVQTGAVNLTQNKQAESLVRQGRAQHYFVIDINENTLKPKSITIDSFAEVSEPAAETVVKTMMQVLGEINALRAKARP